ncbi:MAG: DUF4012 domain-containing protein [Candidatus Gracilibacteria bacterium]|jgi:hypothetical protein
MIRLDIDKQMKVDRKVDEPVTPVSRHVLNLKGVDLNARRVAHETVSVDLKAEIKSHEPRGKIQIVGGRRLLKKGLGRTAMIGGSVLILFVLMLGQMMFLGKKEGKEALALAGEGFVSLQNAGESLLAGTSTNGNTNSNADSLELFATAQTLFEDAKEKGSFLLNATSPWLTEPAEVQSLKNLLDAGTLLADVGTHFGRARSGFGTLPAEGSITEYLRTLSETELEPAATDLKKIETLLNDVDLSGTVYADKFTEFRSKLTTLNALLNTWISVKEPLLTALGDRYPQHYLVLLENNDEMRLGGGFIGSYAIAEINDGRLTDLNFQDVYKLDNQYFGNEKVPVHELTALTPVWRLRDSNTSADFPTSAKNAMHFLELEGGQGVDGVIGVNSSSAQALLAEIGPLKIDSLPVPLTAENFPIVVSTLVEAKTYGQNPKLILQEILDAVLTQKMATASDNVGSNLFQKVGMRMFAESQKKQILFYHKDPAVEEMFENLNLSGSLPALATQAGDFFMPLFTNIGGNKTDRYIKTALTHDTQLLEDGTQIDTVTLDRTNTFTAGTLAWIKTTLASYGFTDWDTTLEYVIGDSANKTGIRIYVPEGSRILDTAGIYRDDVQYYYDEDQKISYFYFEQTLNQGESKSTKIQFTLPKKLTGDFKEYNFAMFRQPGLKSVTYKKTVTASSPDAEGGLEFLSASTPASRLEMGTDYLLEGAFNNDWEVKLLYK